MAIIRPTGYLSHYGFSPEETEEHLAHYGVKGMKWGKRLKTRAGLAIQQANAKADDYESKRRMAQLYEQGAADSQQKAAAADDARNSYRTMANRNKETALEHYRYASKLDKFAPYLASRERESAKLQSKRYNENMANADRENATAIAERSAAATRRVKQAAYARQAKANKSGARVAVVRGVLNKLKKNPDAGNATLTNTHTGEKTVIKKKNRRLGG